VGKIKGTVLITVIKFLRSRKEEGKKATPEHLHHYLESRILAANWYPEYDYLELLRATASLFDPGPGIDRWEELGRFAACSYIDEAYQILIRKGDAAGTLKNFGLLWELRHDTGKAEVTSLLPGTALIKIRDYILVDEELCRAIQGTIRGMLESAGIEGIQITKGLCRARGDELCAWQIQWDIEKTEKSQGDE
jgi:hypothetical protein